MTKHPDHATITLSQERLSLEMDGTEIAHDFFDYMQAYATEALPDRLEQLSPDLAGRLCQYLQSLVQDPAPPDPDLLEAYLAYLEPQAIASENLGDFNRFRQALQQTLIQLSEQLTFKPASPGFVEGAIQKAVIGRDPKDLAETLILIFKALAKRAELTRPDTFDLVNKAFSRRGDFHVCQVDEFILAKSFPMKDLFSRDPLVMKLPEVWRLLDTADKTDFVVPAIAGITIALSSSPGKFQSDGTGKDMVLATYSDALAGLINFHVTAKILSWSAPRTVKVTLFASPQHIPLNSEKLQKYHLNIAARVFVTHYYAIVR
ncbi:hypothetical protein O4H49_04310 [Kiloniella laminariae]|uniref:Uncharacterized protein n=1 Tax=Kiloniella laminariae TaxID=454162 RepID=A0ABT4LFW5_9PROT|nr:hypothetical protein [Kiloniella laminariae]MCZ4279988.1 hypothetical protein [Kiloniella laminariae]